MTSRTETTTTDRTAAAPRRLAALLIPVAALLALAAPLAARAAGAATANTILIDGIGNSGATRDRTEALALGFDVEVVTDAAVWNAKTTADFATYKAIALPDNYCGGPSSTALANRATWSPAVTGNVLVVGGDPELHADYGAGAGPATLVRNAIGFAANDTGKTGLYVSIGCSAVTTAIDQFGTFTAASTSTDSVHIVAIHPALTGLTDALLSNWGTSTHLSFPTRPASFVPLAIQDGMTGTGSTCFADGHCGTVFLLARGTGVQPVGLNLTNTGPATASVGGDLTYALTYGNTGGTDASGVVITATVPTGTTFKSASGGGTLSGSTVTWNVGSLAKGVTGQTLSLVVTVNASGSIKLTGSRITDGTSSATASDVTTTVAAPPIGITVTGGTAAYAYPGTAVVVDPGVVVTSPSNLDNATVDISAGFVAGQDVLACTPSGGITCSYNAATGVLTLSGAASAAAYQAVLRTVTYDNSAGASASTAARTISFTMGSGLRYPGTSHFYEFVASAGVTWDAANTAASGRTYFGLQGYLVTVTSAGENAFVKGKLAQNAWMGLASPSTTNPRTWSWVTGPEAGTAIYTESTGCDTGSSSGTGSVIGSNYVNWRAGEPNNCTGETKGHFYSTDGAWNDFAPDNAGIGGYVVEYGGMAGDPSVTLSGSRALSVTISAFPVAFQTDGTAGAGLTGATSQTILAGGSSTAVTAVAPASHYFVNWTGTGGFATTTANPVTSTGVSAAQVVTAHFAAKAAATLSLGSSANPSTYGAAVTLTATAGSTVATPTGSIVFRDGATTLCTAPLSGGVATCAVPLFAAASHALTASYAGDAFNLAASASLAQVVDRAPTATALSASPSPSTYGQFVTLTATVSATPATFGGTIAFFDGGAPIAGCALQPLSGATATCALPATLAGGSHAFTAAYAGDASFLGSTSAALAHTVAKATPTVIAATSNPLSAFGEPVTFSATVSFGVFAPGGQVTFKDGAATVCGPVPVGVGGAAACATQVLAVGTHAVTAVYAGDGNFLPVTSSPLTQYVVRGTTTSDVVADLAQAVWGQPVTLTATVSPDAPSVQLPTGTFTFRDSAAVICESVPVSAAGTATCVTSQLSVAVHAVSARYNGSPGYAPSTSFAFAVRVDQAASQPTLAASPASSVFGQPVTFTLGALPVAPGAGVPSGTVTLSDAGVPLAGCSGLTLSAGAVTCTTSALATGGHPLTLAYAGDVHFLAGSAGFGHTVAPAATATTLAAAPATPVYGEAVTLTSTTAVVAPGAGQPTGQVEFFDGATSLGTASTSAAGVATLTVPLPAAGAHAFTAAYAGSASFQASTSAARALTVGQAAPAIALASSAPGAAYGRPVTFTATLAGPAGAATPGGTVAFTDGATVLCAASAVVDGAATCTRADLLPGSHPIHAAATGDARYLPAAADLEQVVARATPTVALLVLPTPSVFGQEVTLAVTVSGDGAAPTGTVTISDQGGPVCAGLDLAGGTASCLRSTFAAGDHALTASYEGDANYLAASGERLHTVERALTDTDLGLSAAAVVFGEPVTLTATVAPVAPGAGFPSGTVDFLDGEALVGSAEVEGLTGLATLTTAALAVGDHALTASYGGDPSFQGSASLDGAPLSVAPAATVVAVASSVPASAFGQPVDLAVEVTAVAPGAGVPGGEVLVSLDGADPVSLPLADGRAVLTRADLAVGAHQVSVHYLGEASFLPADGQAEQLVEPAATTVALAAAPAPSVSGQPVTVTATVAVTAPGAGTPGGTVTLLDGEVELASAPLDPSGVATFDTAALAVGGHLLTAAYAGDASFSASTGTLAHAVEQAASSLALAASSAAPAWAAPVTFTATAAAVAPGAGVPSGLVTFVEGATVLGSAALDAAGVATLTTTGLAPGPHLVEAHAEGDARFLPSTALPVAVEVQPAPVQVELSLSLAAAAFGEPVSFAARVTAEGGSTATPDGTLELSDGATSLATLALDAGGRAAGSLPLLEVGDHPIQARFVASDRFAAGASPVQLLAVARGTTQLELASSLAPSTYGNEVTFTAQVAVVAPAAGTPTGLVTFLDGATTLGSAPVDALGAASLTTSALHAGVHPITAAYAGDARFAPASSALSQVVAKAPVTGVVSADPATPVHGQPVAVSVAFTSSGGIPSGQVTVAKGATTLALLALDAGGQGGFTTAALATGRHALVARYDGDADHLAGATGPLTVEVLRAPTATALALAPAAPVFGQAVTLTATVTVPPPGAAALTGAVAFTDGAAPVAGCAAVPVIGGVATCTTAALAAGGHALAATFYTGSGDLLGSASPATAFEVARAAVQVALVPVPATAASGQEVALEVAVTATAPGAGTPSGTVQLTDGDTVLGTVTLAGGTGRLATSALAVGGHPLVATYAGDGSFLAGSGTASVEVGRAATSATLAVQSTSRFGEPVTLSAAFAPVAPGAGTPTGSATFKDGAAVLGTVALAAGQASLSTAALDVGPHALTVEFAGDAAFTGATAAAGLEVLRAGSTLQASAGPSPAAYGQAVTVTVALAAVGPGAGAPAGQVMVRDGEAVACSGPATAGAFSCTLPRPAAGAHALEISFDGGQSFLPAAGGAAFAVEPGTTELALASSRNPSRRGRDVAFTATATSPFATPTGTVTFRADGVVLGTAALVDGVATFTDRSLVKQAAPYEVTAELAASPEFASASATLPGGQVVENSPPVAGAGTALAFGPGAASRAAIPLGGALDGAAFTLEAWVKPAWTAASEAGAAPTVLALGAGDATRLALGVSPDRTQVTFTAGATARAVTAPVDDGAWHHLALTGDGGTIRLYVDGLLADAVEATLDAAGADLALGDGFVGQVDELRAWSVARTAADLRADGWRALPGSTEGLAGCWHLDESDGTELFDAGAAHRDGRATLAAAEGAAFAPSSAWSRHEVKQERELQPAFAAGYDVDGDALALSIAAPAAHGTAHLDQAARTVGYLAGTTLGADAFTYSLSDGDASSSYALALEVTRTLTCSASADCGGGDVCLQGVCTAPAAVTAAASGLGCSTGSGSATGLWAILALGLLRRRRRTA